MLLQALLGCAGVTLRSVATAMRLQVDTDVDPASWCEATVEQSRRGERDFPLLIGGA